MALRSSVVAGVLTCAVLMTDLLARAGDGEAPAAPKPAESVRFGAAPEGLRLEITAPKSSYWPGEWIRPEVSLVNGSKKDVPVVLPRDGSQWGQREPLLTWTAAYVAADGTETPVVPRKPFRCGTGIDDIWQDEVVALKAGERVALAPIEDPTVTLDLQAPGKVRLRLRYAYSAGKATGSPAAAEVPTDTGAMGAQAPFEIAQAVDVAVERPLDVVVEQSGAIRAGADTRLADALRVRAVGKDGAARTLPASRWWIRFEFDAHSGVGLDTTNCWDRRRLTQDVAVPAGGTAPLPLELSMTCKTAREGTCRARAVLQALDPEGGGPTIVSAWIDVRVSK